MSDSPDRLRTRVLRWTLSPPARKDLQRQGYHVLTFDRLARLVDAARPAGSSRSSLANPASRVLALFRRHPRLAVLGVTCRTVDDLVLLHGYLVEPAFRAGCRLLVGADRELASLAAEDFSEPVWGCPWTLERLRHLTGAYAVEARVPGPEVVPRWRQLVRRLFPRGDTPPRLVPHLDPEQNAAVGAGDGVVQVIAPAGSGKTTVLVARVRELSRRGTRPERILCSTFNRDACVEMAARLAKGGLDGVNVRSFHGLGLAILKEEKRLRGGIAQLDDGQWRELAGQAAAQEPGSEALDGQAAQSAVGNYKLALMITPEKAWALAQDQGPVARAQARVYGLYQSHLQDRGLNDFDDLICETIALLQENPQVREKWQARFERVLVDEYQDIEPAQALLIGLLAAPHDSLFCVGDEDQCIYAWRRASVQRVIDLDQTYPGLERYPLVRNYRCGRRITHASRRLIKHNRVRFRKPLLAGISERGTIRVWALPGLQRGGDFVARLLRDTPPGKAAVLARTGRLLTGISPFTEVCQGVELATVHGAKGREWDHVILYGADQGQFPLAQALAGDTDRESGLEDERRLFYVALTRARLRLDIVCTARSPSQFLREAGLRLSRPR